MKQTFRALNGLRFFAAMSVVLYHYSASVSAYHRSPVWAQNLVLCGPVSLGFFFILSGFVLTHAHPSLKDQRLRCQFWVKRFTRLYPAYLLAFLMFVPIAVDKYLLHPAQAANPGGVRTFVLGALLSGLMVQAWTSLSQAWNGPSWSVSVEVFFYIIFPFVLPQLSKLRMRNLILVCGIGWAAMVSIAFAESRHHASSELWTGLLRNNPLLWCPMFLIGMSLARLIPIWRRVPPIVADLTCGLSAGSVLLACAFCPPQYQELLITGGLAGPLATVVLAYSHDSAVIPRFVGNHILSSLGRVSYITYIIQAPIWHFFELGLRRILPQVARSTRLARWEFVVYLALLICSSFFIEAFFQEPWKGKLTVYFGQLAGLRPKRSYRGSCASSEVSVR